MIFLGFLIIAFLYVASAWIGAGLDSSLLLMVLSGAPFTFLFVMSGLAGYVLICGRKEFVRGMKTFFAFSFPPDEDTHETGKFFLRLAEFTAAWGLFGMVIGVLWAMVDLNPDTIGVPFALCLLSFLYASGLAVFVFLPIGLRLSPSALQPAVSQRLAIRLLILGLVGFFLIRCLVVILLRVTMVEPPDWSALFAFNPADPGGNYNPFLNFHVAKILIYIDLPCFILMVGSGCAFWLASGKCRASVAAPVIILMGIFWSIQSFVLMLSSLNLDTFGIGYVIAMNTTLYGFIAAAGFLIVDMLRGFNDSPSLPPAEGTEEAKEIIDRAVEDVQKRKG